MIREPMTVQTSEGAMAVELQFDVSDPLAVSLHFPDADMTWTFARDLLIVGAESPMGAGPGDVYVYAQPGLGVVSVRMSSPTGRLVVHLPREVARHFVKRMLGAVPLNRERVDVDAWLAEVLA